MNIRLIIMLLATVMVGAGAVYWFVLREDPQKAIQALQAQNIDLSEDGFITEVKAGHADNVHRFIIAAGANAATLDKDKNPALVVAAEGSDKATISMLLATLPANPQDAATVINIQDTTGKTALLAAADRGDADTVDQLLSRNADVSLANHTGETPLIAAIKHKNDALVSTLINADKSQHNPPITLQMTDNTGDSPLIYAIREQDKDIVKTLLDAKVDITSSDLRGTTPLMVAAEVGNQDIAEMLLQAGAKIDVADKYGATPLINAISHNHSDLAKFFVNKGGNPDFHTADKLPLQVSLEAKPFDSGLFTFLLARSKQVNNTSGTLLFEAVDRNDPDIVNALLESGLKPNIANENGETLLYHAIESGNQDIVLELITKGADVTQTGVTGISPIERAVKRNEARVVSKLLDMGAQADQKTTEGYTLADTAIYSGEPEILSALLDKGAKVDKDFGVLWAIRDGKGKAVSALLAHGANPNVMSANGDPALWLAASAGETEAVQALIAYHASVDFPNKAQSTTPLAIASHTGQLDAVKLLLAAGANIEAKDAFGMTPLAHAAYMTHPDVVEFLLSKGASIHAADSQGRSVAELAGLASASPQRDKVMMLLNRR
jgi:serine/threonine-protein phosphatase 6 regulatory ankyrin repeat subunit B